MSALFADQVAVVTGASSGIGRAIALGLGTHGARLVLIGRDRSRLEAVAAAARAAPQAIVYQADLTDDANIRQLPARVQQDLGPVDLLIHSAGILTMGPLGTAPIADFDCQYRTNVRAPYLLTQVLLPMLLSRRGQIVFINSSVVMAPRAGVGQYAATKAALKAVADSLRDEVNASGVRVLSVFPGRTATPMQMAILRAQGSAQPMDRLLQPADVAEVVIRALGLPPTAEVTDLHIRPMQK